MLALILLARVVHLAHCNLERDDIVRFETLLLSCECAKEAKRQNSNRTPLTRNAWVAALARFHKFCLMARVRTLSGSSEGFCLHRGFAPITSAHNPRGQVGGLGQPCASGFSLQTSGRSMSWEKFLEKKHDPLYTRM